MNYIQKYLEYLSAESKYSHINAPKTYQDFKKNYIEISIYFTNAVS